MAHLWMALAAACLGTEDAGDLQKLQGTWNCKSIVVDGKKKDETKHGGELVIKGNHYTLRVYEDEPDNKVMFEIHPDKEPKQIDLMPSAGPHKGKVAKGIYKLEGETLTVCVARPGIDRPSDFTSKPGSERLLRVYNKVKP